MTVLQGPMHLNTKYLISAIGFEETEDLFFKIIIIFQNHIYYICRRVGGPRCFRTGDFLSCRHYPLIIVRRLQFVKRSSESQPVNKLAKMRGGKSHFNVKI